MIPIGLGLAWVGYSFGIWGYCLVRGYDVTFMQLFKPAWPGAGTGAAAKSPAPKAGTTGAATGTTQAPGTSTAGGRG